MVDKNIRGIGGIRAVGSIAHYKRYEKRLADVFDPLKKEGSFTGWPNYNRLLMHKKREKRRCQDMNKGEEKTDTDIERKKRNIY